MLLLVAGLDDDVPPVTDEAAEGLSTSMASAFIEVLLLPPTPLSFCLPFIVEVLLVLEAAFDAA